MQLVSEIPHTTAREGLLIITQKMDENSKKLGFGALVGIIFGMMVGSGLYNIPQNLAIGAGAGAVALAWIITAAGMMLLVATCP